MRIRTLLTAAAIALSVGVGLAYPVSQAAAGEITCDGNACSVISVAWDNGAGKYLFSNHSSRNVRVELHNWACTNTLDLGPNEQQHAFVTMFEVPYHANYR